MFYQVKVKASNARISDGCVHSVARSPSGATLTVEAIWENSLVSGIGGNQTDK